MRTTETGNAEMAALKQRFSQGAELTMGRRYPLASPFRSCGGRPPVP